MKALRRLYLIQLLLVLVPVLTADAQTYFRKEIDLPGEMAMEGNHITTFDGGTVHFVSSYNSMQSSMYLTAVKLTANTGVQWTRRFNCTSASAAQIVQAADSSYFLCYTDFVTYGTYHVVHLDPSGNIIYAKTFSAVPPYGVMTTPNIIVRGNGSCYVIGDIVDLNTMIYMEHVFHLDANGNLMWSHVYNMQLAKSYHMDADTCANGDLLILGSNFDVNTTTHAPLLTRITPTGVMLWSKYFPVNGYDLLPKSIECFPGDRVAVASYNYNASTFLSETVLMRCDGQGNVLWSFLYSAPGDGLAVEEMMIAENATTVIVASTLYGSVMMKHDTTGLLLCERYYRDLGLFSADTLTGGGYGFDGLNFTSSRLTYITTGSCGASCMDSAFTIIKTPLNVSIAAMTGDTAMPLTDSVFAVLVAPPTVHVEDVCNTTGFEEESQAQIDAYPNPCNGLLYIRNAGNFETMRLLDVSGKVVLSRNVTSHTMEIDVSALPGGIYFLRLDSGVNYSIRKIVVTGE